MDFHKILAAFLLAMSVALVMVSDYLTSDQSYIFNFQMLFLTVLLVTVIILAQTLTYGVIARGEFPIFPLMGSFGFFFLALQLGEALSTWVAFQTDLSFNGLIHILCFMFYYWQMIYFTDNKRRLCITVSIPVLLFTCYSYLNHNHFFNQRPGSYPVYVEALYKHVLKESRIKSVDEFFDVDKKE